MTRILVTGGVRSGKSAHAERLIARMHEAAVRSGADGPVTYVAAGPAYDDADWAARIAKHRAARPADWLTIESRDLVGALAAAPGPVLVDCLGTWLQGVLDEAELWEAPVEEIERFLGDGVDAVVAALTTRREGDREHDVVLVTNEVGLGVVPDHRSGRLFRDLLGTLNQRVGAACDRVHLVVAGRVLEI